MRASWMLAARAVAGSTTASSLRLLAAVVAEAPRKKPMALSRDVRVDEGTVAVSTERRVSPREREVGRLVWEGLLRRVREELDCRCTACGTEGSSPGEPERGGWSSERWRARISSSGAACSISDESLLF